LPKVLGGWDGLRRNDRDRSIAHPHTYAAFWRPQRDPLSHRSGHFDKDVLLVLTVRLRTLKPWSAVSNRWSVARPEVLTKPAARGPKYANSSRVPLRNSIGTCHGARWPARLVGLADRAGAKGTKKRPGPGRYRAAIPRRRGRSCVRQRSGHGEDG